MPTRPKLLALTLALFSLTACTSLHSDSGEGPALASSGVPQAEIQTEILEKTNYYYEFMDIPVPRELTFQAEESYVFDTNVFKSGVMIFTGRMNNADLVNFFIQAMAKDGWTLVTSLKAEKSILIFDKFNKDASIQIQSGGFKSRVVIVAVEAKNRPGGATLPKASGSTSSYSSGAYTGAVKEQDLK